jgi:hypothetical protein
MRGKSKRRGICAFCGIEGIVTLEHFVPRCLWCGPRPVRTETVPVCERCDEGSNIDDDDFRNTLVMMFDQEHPQKRALLGGKVRRSLLKHPGRIKDTLRKVKIQPMFSPSGLWLGNFPVLPLERERFERRLQKIIKGLYFLIRKRAFPTDGEINIIGHLNARTRELVSFIEASLFAPTFNFGDDVFEWRFSQTTDGALLWKLAFYQSVVFYATAFERAPSIAEIQEAVGQG